MPVSPTIQDVQPTVGGSADTWGGVLNARLQEAYDDIFALATQGNSTETAFGFAVLVTGSTSTGDQILANVGPTSQYSAGYRGLPVVSVDVDRTFLLTDAGKMVRLFGAVSKTWTIPPNSSVAFPIGTVIVLRNFATATLNIARGAGVSLRQVGSATDANATLASFGRTAIIKEDTDIWVMG